MGWKDVGAVYSLFSNVRPNELPEEAVVRHAEEYAKTQQEPIDAEDAKWAYEEAMMHGCAKVYGERSMLDAYRRIMKEDRRSNARNSL